MALDKRIIFEVLKKFKAQNPDFKKKLKIFLLVGAVGLVLTAGLAIWAGVAALNYVASLATSPVVQQQVGSLKSEIKTLPQFALVGCLNKAQSFLNIQAFFERPLADQALALKTACFPETAKSCEGPDCNTW